MHIRHRYFHWYIVRVTLSKVFTSDEKTASTNRIFWEGRHYSYTIRHCYVRIANR